MPVVNCSAIDGDEDGKGAEKAVKAVLDALGLNYRVEPSKGDAQRPLNKAELALYKSLKKSLEEIKLHQEGKITLKSIDEVLAEL